MITYFGLKASAKVVGDKLHILAKGRWLKEHGFPGGEMLIVIDKDKLQPDIKSHFFGEATECTS